MDWNNRERNVAKVDFNNYIEDFSIFNHSHVDTSSTLFMNYAYGILTLLNFEGLDIFIDNNKDIYNNLDSYLCELKESQIRTGLHIYCKLPSISKLESFT